jgi:transposase
LSHWGLSMFFEYDRYEFYICPFSVDMRSGAQKLAQIVIAQMDMDPLSKKMFLFTGKDHKGVKVLVWDRNGWWVHYKRLYRGTFAWPRSEEAARKVTIEQVKGLFSGEDRWRKLPELYGELA